MLMLQQPAINVDLSSKLYLNMEALSHSVVTLENKIIAYGPWRTKYPAKCLLAMHYGGGVLLALSFLRSLRQLSSSIQSAMLLDNDIFAERMPLLCQCLNFTITLATAVYFGTNLSSPCPNRIVLLPCQFLI